MRCTPLIAVLALAASTSCSSSQKPTAPPPANGGSYASAQAIIDRLSAAGAACPDVLPIANPTLAGTLSMSQCKGASSADQDTVVVVFDTHEHAKAYAVEPPLDPGFQQYVVLGVNWAVSTVPAFGPKVLAALGGQRTQ